MKRLRAVVAAFVALSVLITSPAFAATTSRIDSVDFVDANTGYVSGGYLDASSQYGFVSKTANGGASWQPTRWLNRWMIGVDALNSSAAWTVSTFTGLSWSTTNGGAAWTQASLLDPLAATPQPNDIAYLGSQTALVVGQQPSHTVNGDVGAIWRTTDGGFSWTRPYFGPTYPPGSDGEVPQTNARLLSVDAAGAGAYAVGWELQPQDRPIFCASTDSGSNWTFGAAPVGMVDLNDVAAVSSGAWVAGGSKAAYWNGSAWGTVRSLPAGFSANAIDALDASNAIVAGSGGRVARTTDGGATWTTYIMPSSISTLRDIAYRDATHAVAVGDNQVIVSLTLGTSISGSIATLAKGAYPPPAPPKASTTLSFGAPTTSAYASAKVYGYLKNKATAKGIYKKPVKIQHYYGGAWKTLATVYTTSTGYYSHTVKPTSKRSYRAVFSEDTAYLGATSVTKTILPKVYLTRPNAPTYMYTSRTYSVTGYLKPRHTAGTYPVRIYKYRRLSNGTYKSYGYVKARAYNYSSYTKYIGKVRLPYKGRWRLRAVHLADSLNAKTYSSYEYVTVR